MAQSVARRDCLQSRLHQQQYIRHRLEAIQLLYKGNTRTEVCEQVGCSYDTLTSWLRKYLQGGLKALIRPIRHQKALPEFPW